VDVLKSWKVSGWVGVTGMMGSVGWFTAMTIQNAAYVRALGQIELVFTFVAAHFFFREKTTRLELFGILLVVAGILVLLLGQ
jgi:drug/metabolite transporter (DMT)-like permease